MRLAIMNQFLVSILACLDMQDSDGILVPGGFGDRGVQGKLLAAKYAREKGVPFLGICLGLQIAVIEFARSVSIIWCDLKVNFQFSEWHSNRFTILDME